MRKFSLRLVGVAGRGNTCNDLGNIHIAVGCVGRNTLSTIMLYRVPWQEDTLAGRFPAFSQARCLGRAIEFSLGGNGRDFSIRAKWRVLDANSEIPGEMVATADIS